MVMVSEQLVPAAATMRAVVQDGYGGAHALRVERVARPSVGDGEVLVRVHAAGLDRGTWHLMTGKPYLMRIAGMGFRGPKDRVPGRDLAGISAGTALQALTDQGRIQAGQRVLIIGGSGGVGSYAVQLAKALGAEVTAVASTAKLDLVRALGADHVLDYTRDDYADGTHRYDLILDIAGNPGLSRLRRALTPQGTAVLVGGEDGGNLTGGLNRQLRALVLSPLVSQRLVWFIAKERASDLDRLADLIETGQVRPSVDRTYALDRVPEAMHHLESGQVRGKVAITI